MTLPSSEGLWLSTAQVDLVFLLVLIDIFTLFPVLLHTNGALFVFWGWGVLVAVVFFLCFWIFFLANL